MNPRQTPKPFLKWAGGSTHLLSALCARLPRRLDCRLFDLNPDVPVVCRVVLERIEDLVRRLAAFFRALDARSEEFVIERVPGPRAINRDGTGRGTINNPFVRNEGGA